MMACKSSMWISTGLKTVNLPYPYRVFLFSFDFQSDLYVSLHKVELFLCSSFFVLFFFSWLWLILYFNCVDQVKNMLLGFLFTLDLDGHTIVSDHVSELLNFIMVLDWAFKFVWIFNPVLGINFRLFSFWFESFWPWYMFE